jgi:hypothetical protein
LAYPYDQLGYAILQVGDFGRKHILFSGDSWAISSPRRFGLVPFLHCIDLIPLLLGF